MNIRITMLAVGCLTLAGCYSYQVQNADTVAKSEAEAQALLVLNVNLGSSQTSVLAATVRLRIETLLINLRVRKAPPNQPSVAPSLDSSPPVIQ